MITTYERLRGLLNSTVYVLDGHLVAQGKLVQGDREGNAYVLLHDGRTVCRDGRYGVFTNPGDAEAIAAELE